MKNDRKKYTFEDWFEGLIDNNDVSKLIIQQAMNKAYGENKPYLPESESKKIRDYQKQTFHRAVEITATTEIRITRKKIHEVKNPENWLKLQIKVAEQFIQDNPKLELKYEENKTESGAIKPVQAKRINEMYERFKKNDDYEGYAGFTVKKNGKGVPSRLTDMYINKLYLDELNRLLNNIRQEKKTDLNIVQKWREKGRLSEAEQIKCVVDIAMKKNITQAEAFEMALNQGIYLGRKKKYSSWKKANTRLNKRNK